MKHPFAGIIVPESSIETPQAANSQAIAAPNCGRRSFFTTAWGALSGAAALLLTSRARAQAPYAPPAISPDTSRPRNAPPASRSSYQSPTLPQTEPRTEMHEERNFTTQALGEEGGDVTTYALGEEGGENQVTTYALGEEGSGGNTSPPVTTYALGEEGGPGQPTTYALGEEGSGGWYTTYALGEEGAGRGRPDGGRVTTYALGEEGAGRRQRRRWRRR